MEPAIRLLPLGERAWTVEFGDRIDPAVHARVLRFCGALASEIDAGRLPGITDIVPTFRSATVHFDPMRIDGATLGPRLSALTHDGAARARPGLRWRLPVAFGGEQGPDLEAVATRCGLPVDDVVARVASTTFEVYVTGFMPGFAYLGLLPAELELPRLPTPRKRVPARSLAIAGRLCGVYPFDSPGGWHLLGTVAVAPFDAAHAERPALLAVGDAVSWTAVEPAELARMERALAGGEMTREDFLDGGVQ